MKKKKPIKKVKKNLSKKNLKKISGGLDPATQAAIEEKEQAAYDAWAQREDAYNAARRNYSK